MAGYALSNDVDATGNNRGFGDYWVVKLDKDGILVWQKLLGGRGNDFAYAVTASPDGGYVVTGYTNSPDGDVTGYNNMNGIWVVKLANQAPTVSGLAASPSPACAGQSVTFTATIANTTGTYSYTLTNNAGTTKTGSASGNTLSQSVTAAGSGNQNFTLTLTVTDPQSGSGADSVNLTVNGSGSSLSAQSGDWNTASTWACGTVPTASSAVQIKAGHVVTIGAVVQAHSLGLEGGAVSFLNGGKLGLEN